MDRRDRERKEYMEEQIRMRNQMNEAKRLEKEARINEAKNRE